MSPRYIHPLDGSAPVGNDPTASGHGSEVTPTPVLTDCAVVTAGESKVSTTSGVASSTTSSSAASPPQATKTRAKIVNRMIPCLRNDFISPP